MPVKRKIRLRKRAKPGKVANKVKQHGKSARVIHDLDVDYSGVSVPVNRNKSRTRIPIEEFGSKPDSTLTPRVNAILTAVRKEYGRKTFKRGNLDSGALKRAGWKGAIVHIGGDPSTEDCRFKLR